MPVPYMHAFIATSEAYMRGHVAMLVELQICIKYNAQVFLAID